MSSKAEWKFAQALVSEKMNINLFFNLIKHDLVNYFLLMELYKNTAEK